MGIFYNAFDCRSDEERARDEIGPDMFCITCCSTYDADDDYESVSHPCRRHAAKPGNAFQYDLSRFFAENRVSPAPATQVDGGAPFAHIEILDVCDVMQRRADGHMANTRIVRATVRAEPGGAAAHCLARLEERHRRYYTYFLSPEHRGEGDDEDEAAWVRHADGSFTVIMPFDGMRVQHRAFSEADSLKFTIDSARARVVRRTTDMDI